MPVLNWIGKEDIVHHDKKVPFKLLKKIKSNSVGKSENLIIEGDNLEALKSLIPFYQNKIKCIYIDPPYNTGNENWVYNDNVNAPKIRKWLGQVVGKDGEDLTRHDKWLCMMYPRLKLLKELLREDGVIFISIDDDEHSNLVTIMKEVFGAENFIANIVWQKKYSPQNDAKYFSDMHDFIVVFAKKKNRNSETDGWIRNLSPRTEEMDARYKNPDSDPRGKWKSADLSAKRLTPKDVYPIKTPSGRDVYPPKGRSWVTPKEKLKKLIEDNRIWFGKKGNNVPSQKIFLSEVQSGTVPVTWWDRKFAGDNQEGAQELKSIFGGKSVFENPKPVKLIKKILEIAVNKNDLVLDSFAGSGTTAHAVLELNKEDNGNRKFILVELEPKICKKITCERLRKAISGYVANGKNIPGLKGGFEYCILDESLFDKDGRINSEFSFEELASYVFFIETKTALNHASINKNFIGEHSGIDYYLIFKKKSNILNLSFVNSLRKKGKKVIYADKCSLIEDELEHHQIVFKQIPYDLRVF